MSHRFPCERKATVYYDGKLYCWQHNPVRVDREKKKAKDKWYKERAQKQKGEDLETRDHQICQKVRDIGLDPREILNVEIEKMGG